MVSARYTIGFFDGSSGCGGSTRYLMQLFPAVALLSPGVFQALLRTLFSFLR
jgi:hypothetical protein